MSRGMSIIHGLNVKHLRGDFYGGLVAAVVALPLALAFGVASGAGAIAGIYGAIFVGFLAALFGGTPAQVSGPTGPMTVVMAGLIAQFGQEPSLAFTAVILGGGLQILLGLSGIGQYISLMPYPVISGFMSGIGVIILILQAAPFVGHAAPPGGVPATLMALPSLVTSPEIGALVVGAVTLGIMTLTPEAIGRLIPTPLIALIAGTLLGIAAFPQIPVIGPIPTGLPVPLWPGLRVDMVEVVIGQAVVLAVLGSIDSLLTSLVCDNMTRNHHDSNRELIGQGIGNTVAGLFGGLPGAGATMRSVINIRTGGRTPLSGMFHAVVLLAVLLGIGPLAERIPLAVLAGILTKVGVDVIDWRFLKHAFQAPRADVIIMMVVFLMTVLADLIMAVGVGLVLASVLFVKRMADLELMNLKVVTGATEELPLNDEESDLLRRLKGKVILIHVDGPMSFGSARNMVRRLEGTAGWSRFSTILLDLSDVPALDVTAALAVEDMIRMAGAHRQHVMLVGIVPAITKVLQGLGVLKLVPADYQFACRLDALRHAVKLAESRPGPEAAPSAGT